MKKGFTLIELLITTAIISLVGIAVYSVFASGIKVWQSGNKSSTYERNIRLVSEKLSRELRNTFKFPNISLEGTGDSVAFAALIKNNQDVENPHYQVGRVTYFLNQENVFSKKQETYPETFQEEKLGKIEELITDVSKLVFSYCYLDNATGDYKWKDEWKPEEQDSLPQAVKIELVFKPESGQESEFSKTIFIPIGTGEQKIVLE